MVWDSYIGKKMSTHSYGIIVFIVAAVLGFGSVVHFYDAYPKGFTQFTPVSPQTGTHSIQEKDYLKDKTFPFTTKQTTNSSNVRVFCWIMTTPVNLATKTKYVKSTWGDRCTYTAYFSSVDNNDFPTIGLKGVKEGRDQLYEKTKAAFKYLWDCCKDDADWFMKADDDTYVIVENLKYMLQDYDTREPMYFGRRFKGFSEQGFMSGGAGYVLSKEALKRFVEGIESKKCSKGGVLEDVELGKCMSVLGVKAMDSRDENNLETFFPLSVNDMLEKNKPDWFWKLIYYPSKPEDPCCSYRPISFHYVTGKSMMLYDYLLYGTRLQSEEGQHGETINSQSRT